MSKPIPEIIGSIVLIFVIIAAISLLLAFPVMWLWNWLMPEIFGLPMVTFLQAWGLMILSGFLFQSKTGNNSK